MVSAKKSNLVRIPSLKRHKKCKRLEAVIPTIHKVSHKNIICRGKFPSYLKKFQQIIELTMNVTTDGDGCRNRLYVTLFNQQITDIITKFAELMFWEVLTRSNDLYPFVKRFRQHFNDQKMRRIRKTACQRKREKAPHLASEKIMRISKQTKKPNEIIFRKKTCIKIC